MEAAVLSIEVLGTPQGARRHRAAKRGDRVVTFHADAHIAAEAAIAAEAIAARVGPDGMPPALDEAVVVEITTHHARPKRLRRQMDRGTGSLPFTGKPDADNVAKLVLDALTKAGVWVDDTRVARLVVERLYLPFSQGGHEVGVPRTSVVVRRWA